MMKQFVKIGLVAILSCVSSVLFAQSTLTGQVFEKGGEALPGATIVVQGTTIGTVTDFDGNFSIDVPSDAKDLLVSFMGYESTVLAIGSGKDLGVIYLEPSTVGLDEVYVTASIVTDRRTPISISTIKPEQILEKLGNQEFPEMLKSTPSIYVTKSSGGFGDSRISLRGFESDNIGVLVNGVPVNDMENGKVYWSNWAGLSDVTQTMQVQRGLGASKVALSSTGGTINIVTRSTDAKKGGTMYAGLGNNGEMKQSFSLSTGMLDNGWAVTFLGAHNDGAKWVEGTEFEAWTYFVNVSKMINDKHRLSFTAFGAPQWHNQRGNDHRIEFYRNHKDDIKANTERGVRNGEWYNGDYGYNEYHKPQLSLNHYWNINSTSFLSTSVYASISNGGGRRAYGAGDGKLSFEYADDAYNEDAVLTGEGYYDYDAVSAMNANNVQGSDVVMSMSTNAHDWYGILSSYNKEFGQFSFTGGFDGRYYRGYHYEEIDDLLGGEFFIDTKATNDFRDPNQKLYVGDKVNYHNLGEVLWVGLFGQAEYVTPEYSSFLSVSVADKAYRRVEYFQDNDYPLESDWQNFTPWSVKAGFSYNITSNQNVFVNGGYFTRVPSFNTVFLGYTNEVNDDPLNEKVITGEVGYNIKGQRFDATATAYWTNWQDKGMTKSFSDATANIPGINARHMGVELQGSWRPAHGLFINFMGSYGDYIWQDDVDFSLYDDQQNFLGNYSAYIGDVHVGNSAQATASIGVQYELFAGLKVGIDGNYAGKNYADFDPTLRTNAPDEGEANPETWQMPDVFLVDMNLRWNFKLGDLDATFYGKVNNLLDTEYIADADEGTDFDSRTSFVYYGFGTTWSSGLKIKF